MCVSVCCHTDEQQNLRQIETNKKQLRVFRAQRRRKLRSNFRRSGESVLPKFGEIFGQNFTTRAPMLYITAKNTSGG
jgi:hypothetical protein